MNSLHNIFFHKSVYDILLFFLIYSFLGWCVEVSFHAVSEHRIVNRGFLNGPVCPIYGFGMITVLLVLVPVGENVVLLFLGGMFLTTLIELAGGFILYHLFHMRWWDYSGERFNLGGYICLKFSIFWGAGIVLFVKFLHPVLAILVSSVPLLIGICAIVLLYLIYGADAAVTVMTVAGLNRRLESLNAISESLHAVSDALTEKIGEKTMETEQKVEETQVQLALGRAEAKDSLLEKKEDFLTKKSELEEKAKALRAELAAPGFFGSRRLFCAFPGMKHSRYDYVLEEIRETIKNSRHLDKNGIS